MRILITRCHSRLGAALVRQLSRGHEVRTQDVVAGGAGGAPTYVGDPRDRDFAAECARACDVIVHLAAPADEGDLSLDEVEGAARSTYNLITTAPSLTRFVLISTLRTFERYPMEWQVSEWWAPRPTTGVNDLAPYLAEVAARELARVTPIQAVALRLGEVSDDETVRGRPADPRWLHVEDAVQAVERALAFTPLPRESRTGWWVFHVPGGGSRTRFPLAAAGQPPFGYSPVHDLTSDLARSEATAEPTPLRFTGRDGGLVRRVVIYGAGGPLAAATTEALVRDHVLRLTDIRPLADIIADLRAKPPAGPPMPRLLGAPHEMQVVDVTDPAQVTEAARGMDAIVNCTVMREHPVEAFRVNVLGAYNVMQAAVECGIRRVVHTGPEQVDIRHPAGYWYDFDVPSDVPARPGTSLYLVTKLLAQEVCRIFAEEHDLEVPALLFGNFADPVNLRPDVMGGYPFSVLWEDAAEAIRQALRAPSFPYPFEVLNIVADLPHGKYSNRRAQEVLKWQPRFRLEERWLRKLL